MARTPANGEMRFEPAPRGAVYRAAHGSGKSLVDNRHVVRVHGSLEDCGVSHILGKYALALLCERGM